MFKTEAVIKNILNCIKTTLATNTTLQKHIDREIAELFSVTDKLMAYQLRSIGIIGDES
jgi:hypothetical protein